ncbi:MAG: aldehyde dehydrogenase [Deltaproteobacteria bacterium]|nr:aldehyde dehydrogenase [Deltaproteobacteria bacterium]MBI3296279.1 aldehyde dehydrogenase [Deltaproteobacteria bacterium]
MNSPSDHLAPRLEWARRWLTLEPKGAVVGGAWMIQGERIAAVNPVDQSTLTHFAETPRETVELAVSRAHTAYASWRKTNRKERAQLLNRIASAIREHHAELATLETLNNGKLYRESVKDDLPEAAEVFEYYAGWTNKLYGETAPVEGDFLNYIVREPLGVCALIVPWNFPLLMACWKMAPALAMGNTVILKPSPFTSLSAIRLFEILEEKNILPSGVINLVLGGRSVGECLSQHPHVAKIAFTGSTPVGKLIASQSALSNLKGVSLELGGKSPNIIFNDPPDLEEAIQRSFEAMFSHKGEKCSEPTRLLVHKDVAKTVIAGLVKRAEAVKCGDPFDARSDQGPQCHKAHYDKVMDYIRIGKEEGARLAAGGVNDRNGSNAHGLFIRPTIFADVRPEMKIAKEEIFGPVLTVTEFTTDDEAVAMANDTVFGLAAGLWTKDITRAHRIAERLDAGQVFINRYGCYDFASPFGGFRQSGWGKEMAIHSLDSYTKRKSVWVKL